MYDDPIIIEPEGPATAAVVWLHGLGADGNDFVPVVPYLGAVTGWTRFVFPHAAVQPVTINDGVAMRAWYDILAMDIGRRIDMAGVRDSEAYARRLLDAQVSGGIPADRLILAGFSQGGAITLHAGVRHPSRLAGLMALSTYMPSPEHTDSEAHPANARTPIFMAHGEDDPVIPLSLAEQSRDHLRAAGYAVEWKTYPMPHSVSPEQLGDIARWLAERLPKV